MNCSRVIAPAQSRLYNRPFQYDSYKDRGSLKIEKNWAQSKTVSKEEKLEIVLDAEIIAELPLEFADIYHEIEESKYILDFDDNWDGEGSIHYEVDTWQRAVQFLTKYSVWAFDKMSLQIPVPKIHPGPDGSIDILWKSSKYRLLINLHPENMASFYGDDYNFEKIKGTFDPSKINQGLLLNLLM